MMDSCEERLKSDTKFGHGIFFCLSWIFTYFFAYPRNPGANASHVVVEVLCLMAVWWFLEKISLKTETRLETAMQFYFNRKDEVLVNMASKLLSKKRGSYQLTLQGTMSTVDHYKENFVNNHDIFKYLTLICFILLYPLNVHIFASCFEIGGILFVWRNLWKLSFKSANIIYSRIQQVKKYLKLLFKLDDHLQACKIKIKEEKHLSSSMHDDSGVGFSLPSEDSNDYQNNTVLQGIQPQKPKVIETLLSKCSNSSNNTIGTKEFDSLLDGHQYNDDSYNNTQQENPETQNGDFLLETGLTIGKEGTVYTESNDNICNNKVISSEEKDKAQNPCVYEDSTEDERQIMNENPETNVITKNVNNENKEFDFEALEPSNKEMPIETFGKAAVHINSVRNMKAGTDDKGHEISVSTKQHEKNGLAASVESQKSTKTVASDGAVSTLSLYQNKNEHNAIPVDQGKETDTFVPMDQTKEAERFVPVDQTKGADEVVPMQKAEEVNNVIPVDKTREADNFVPVDQTKEADNVIPVDKSREADKFVPVDHTKEASNVILVDTTKEAGTVVPVDQNKQANQVVHREQVKEADKVKTIDQNKVIDKFVPVDKPKEADKFVLVDQTKEPNNVVLVGQTKEALNDIPVEKTKDANNAIPVDTTKEVGTIVPVDQNKQAKKVVHREQIKEADKVDTISQNKVVDKVVSVNQTKEAGKAVPVDQNKDIDKVVLVDKSKEVSMVSPVDRNKEADDVVPVNQNKNAEDVNYVDKIKGDDNIVSENALSHEPRETIPVLVKSKSKQGCRNKVGPLIEGYADFGKRKQSLVAAKKYLNRTYNDMARHGLYAFGSSLRCIYCGNLMECDNHEDPIEIHDRCFPACRKGRSREPRGVYLPDKAKLPVQVHDTSDEFVMALPENANNVPVQDEDVLDINTNEDRGGQRFTHIVRTVNDRCDVM